MIILDLLRTLSDNRRSLPSSQLHGSIRMESRSLQLLPILEVRLDYPADIPQDILSAAEMIVILLAPAFAQLGSCVQRALIEVLKVEVKVSLFQDDGALVKAYTFPVDALTNSIKNASQRLETPEAKDLPQWALKELDTIFREHKLW